MLGEGFLEMPEKKNFSSIGEYVDTLMAFYLRLQYFIVVERNLDKAIALMDIYLPFFIEQPTLFSDLPTDK